MQTKRWQLDKHKLLSDGTVVKCIKWLNKQYKTTVLFQHQQNYTYFFEVLFSGKIIHSRPKSAFVKPNCDCFDCVGFKMAAPAVLTRIICVQSSAKTDDMYNFLRKVDGACFTGHSSSKLRINISRQKKDLTEWRKTLFNISIFVAANLLKVGSVSPPQPVKNFFLELVAFRLNWPMGILKGPKKTTDCL